MALFPPFDRPSDKFDLHNVFVGTHSLLLDPAKSVVVVFALPEGKSGGSKLAKRMLLELHTRAGLPKAGLVNKLAALEGPALAQVFKDNFKRVPKLGLEYSSAGTQVEFYGASHLLDEPTLASDQVFVYAF